MTVRRYDSTQLGAPTLSGTAGALITVLDAVLVNGYGSVSVSSITRSGTTATATTATAHGLATGDVATIAGATETDYNGNFVVTVTSSTTFTYTVANSPTTPATGTITSKRAGAGWTKPFTGTNLAAFRNSATLGTGFYLDVNDAAPGTGGAREARVRGYEAMTAVGTGTNPFPTLAQQSATTYAVRKSLTLDATARDWLIVCDETVFYMVIDTGDMTNPTIASMWMFGDFVSYKANDPYRCMIVARPFEFTTAVASFYSYESFCHSLGPGTALSAVSPAHYIARSHTGAGGSVPVNKLIDAALADQATNNTYTFIGYYTTSRLPYPNAVDGGLYMSPVRLTTGAAVRGHMKGVWAPLHHQPLSHWDVLQGAGGLAGKSFVSVRPSVAGSSSQSGNVLIETSDTWS